MFFVKNILKTKSIRVFFFHFKPKAISVNKIFCFFWKVCGKYHFMTNVFDKRHIQSNCWNVPADINSVKINFMFCSEMYQRRTLCYHMQEICSRKMPFRIKDVTQKICYLVAGTLPWVWCLPSRKGSQFRIGFLHSTVLQVIVNGHGGEIKPQLVHSVAKYSVRILQIIDW